VTKSVKCGNQRYDEGKENENIRLSVLAQFIKHTHTLSIKSLRLLTSIKHLNLNPKDIAPQINWIKTASNSVKFLFVQLKQQELIW
jgi:hypothetical protein